MKMADDRERVSKLNDNHHKYHKDVDARWTKKRDEIFTATNILKLRNAIRSYFLMIPRRQSAHDSKGFEGLLDERRRQGLVFWTPVIWTRRSL